jgi:shikimate 5-dehydrogenase
MIKDYQSQKELRDHYDICIIGAGPAGITLALRLAGNGRHVVLIEAVGTSIHRFRRTSTSARRQAEVYAWKHACAFWAVPPITGRDDAVHSSACRGSSRAPARLAIAFSEIERNLAAAMDIVDLPPNSGFKAINANLDSELRSRSFLLSPPTRLHEIRQGAQ